MQLCSSESLDTQIFMFAGLSNPPLAPHNQNQYNREANCIEQADESAALPIFVFMVAQVKTELFMTT